MSLAGANVFENSAAEGTGKTTVNHPDIDTDPGSAPADHVHVDFDLAHKACLAEIASLFEDIQSDLRIITDRGDDRSKGIYQRQADNVANNPANIAKAARDFINLKQSDILDLVNAEVGNPTNLGNTSAANYNAIRNSTTSAGGFVGGNKQSSQSPGYGNSATAIKGENGEVYYEGSIPFDQIVPQDGGGVGNVTYALGGVRNLPIQTQLWEILQTAAITAGVDVVITSGGQVPASEGGVKGKNRVGSNRHDKGYAADVRLLDGNGNRLYTSDSTQLAIMTKFIQACEAQGATGVGCGNGYMSNGNIHVDIAWVGQTQGVINGVLSNRYWGGSKPTNTASAPKYLVDIMETRDNTA